MHTHSFIYGTMHLNGHCGQYCVDSGPRVVRGGKDTIEQTIPPEDYSKFQQRVWHDGEECSQQGLLRPTLKLGKETVQQKHHYF